MEGLLRLIIVVTKSASNPERVGHMNKALQQGVYNIQQVADITGLSKQAIRKWEERYKVVQPKRLENGYRIYSDKDINTLLTVKSLAEQGHSIKQAALMATIDNDPLVEELSEEYSQQLEHDVMNDYVLQLLQNAKHCNEQGMGLQLQQAYHHFGLEKFLTAVVVPFLKEIGQQWSKKTINEFQEGLASIVVRDFLIGIRRNFHFQEQAPIVVGACLPNEQHEVPVHIILLQAMMKGWKTILIGASPAPGSIEAMVEKLKPKKVLLSATTTLPFIDDPELLGRLDHFAGENKNIEFYLGGAGSIEFMKGKLLSNIHVTNEIEEVLH